MIYILKQNPSVCFVENGLEGGKIGSRSIISFFLQ